MLRGSRGTSSLVESADKGGQYIGVSKGGHANKHGYMDNSTAGFVTNVVGLPPNFIGNLLPGKWLNRGGKCKLVSTDMAPSGVSVKLYEDLCRFEIAEVLRSFISGVEEKLKGFSVPIVELADCSTRRIFVLDAMKIEQQSVSGNLMGIKYAVEEELEITAEAGLEKLILVGGDQLLKDRVRAIMKQRESDVPGENFESIHAMLGMLHTMMNFAKLICKHHLGKMATKDPSSLRFRNTMLGLERLDEKASNFWNTATLIRRCVKAFLMCLVVRQAGFTSLEAFQKSFAEDGSYVHAEGEVKTLEGLVEKVCEMLAFTRVATMREEEEDKRDVVLENMLLFVRLGIQFIGMYDAMRRGDVGVMQGVLDCLTAQFIGGDHHKYATELMEISCGFKAEWSEELCRVRLLAPAT